MRKIIYFSYWVMLSLMISFLYIYRNQALEFKELFLASLFPGRVIEKQPGSIEVSIGEGGHFYINSKLNGVPVRFMVDTGASSICITKDIAKSAGIDLGKLVFNQIFQTANGVAKGASAKIDTLKVGNYEVKNIYVSVSNDGLSTPLLGMSFLNRMKSYTFKGNILHLEY